MKNENIVTINGKEYSSSTGLNVEKPVVSVRNTVYNRTIKNTDQRKTSLIQRAGRHMDIARTAKHNHTISKNTPVSEVKAPIVIKKRPIDITPKQHPLIKRVNKIRTEKNQIPPTLPVKSLKDIKEEAISEALSKTVAPQAKKSLFKRHTKMINIFSLIVIVLSVIIYVVYCNIPNISVKFANARAGIEATYPEYRPDGYRLSGPVSYSNGEVIINFQANTGNTGYKITQTKSLWDSSAVKEDVNKKSKGEFLTTEERGLTIYTYNSNAAWVNGGILYNITGNAPLSRDQIQRIAMSL